LGSHPVAVEQYTYTHKQYTEQHKNLHKIQKFTYNNTKICIEQHKHLHITTHPSVWAVWWAGECVRVHSPSQQTTHIEGCKTYSIAYTHVSLRMNPRSSKHVGDIRY
jgi:hypothetical protein